MIGGKKQVVLQELVAKLQWVYPSCLNPSSNSRPWWGAALYPTTSCWVSWNICLSWRSIPEKRKNVRNYCKRRKIVWLFLLEVNPKVQCFPECWSILLISSTEMPDQTTSSAHWNPTAPPPRKPFNAISRLGHVGLLVFVTATWSSTHEQLAMKGEIVPWRWSHISTNFLQVFHVEIPMTGHAPTIPLKKIPAIWASFSEGLRVTRQTQNTGELETLRAPPKKTVPSAFLLQSWWKSSLLTQTKLTSGGFKLFKAQPHVHGQEKSWAWWSKYPMITMTEGGKLLACKDSVDHKSGSQKRIRKKRRRRIQNRNPSCHLSPAYRHLWGY